MSTPKAEQLRQEWRVRLDRLLDGMIEPEASRALDEAFGAPTLEQRAQLEQERREVQRLEAVALAGPPPRKKRSLALRMYGWRKRHGG